MRKLTLVVLVLAFCVPPLVAEDIDPEEPWRRGVHEQRPVYTRYELTPLAGYRYGGTLYDETSDLFRDDVGIASSLNLGLVFGIPIAHTPMKLELMVNRQGSHFTTGDDLFEPGINVGDVDITYYHAGVQFPWGDPHGIQPFFTFSGGVTNINPDLDFAVSENRFSMAGSIGVKVPLNPHVGFRFEARGYFTFIGDEDNGDFGCGDCYYDYWGHDLYQGETLMGLVFSF